MPSACWGWPTSCTSRDSIETMGSAKYPTGFFIRVITVSLETQKIVNGLPPLEVLASNPEPEKLASWGKSRFLEI